MALGMVDALSAGSMFSSESLAREAVFARQPKNINTFLM